MCISESTKPDRRVKGKAPRRGLSVLLFLVFFPVAILAIAAILYFLSLFFLQRSQTTKADLLGSSLADELLSEKILLDLPVSSFDDRQQVATVAGELLARSNGSLPEAQQLYLAKIEAPDLADWTFTEEPKKGGVHLQIGYLPHALVENPGSQFTKVAPYNTLVVEVSQSFASANPLWLMMNQLVAGGDYQVQSRIYAFLDKRVLAFGPRADTPTPLIPLALSEEGWEMRRHVDTNSNGRKELELYFPIGSIQPAVAAEVSGLSSGAVGIPHFDGAWIALDEGSFSATQAKQQWERGILPTDLAGASGSARDKMIGPAKDGQPWRLPNGDRPHARQVFSLAEATKLREPLASGSDQVLHREVIFPLYRSVENMGDGTSGRVNIEGFVGGKVVSREFVFRTFVDATGTTHSQQYFLLRVEPAFVSHPTAVTNKNVPENRYLYNVRLLR
ncbi:MAG: hypothetical protein MPJ24_02405 [Pirellulaceae bacterium]|nr:hypothetical protein [Pirellulaceae bacterium]